MTCDKCGKETAGHGHLHTLEQGWFSFAYKPRWGEPPAQGDFCSIKCVQDFINAYKHRWEK